MIHVERVDSNGKEYTAFLCFVVVKTIGSFSKTVGVELEEKKAILIKEQLEKENESPETSFVVKEVELNKVYKNKKDDYSSGKVEEELF